MNPMLAIPIALAGMFVSQIVLMYLLRWAALVHEMLRPIPAPKYCVQRKRRSLWLAPFVLLNPVPWLFLATPYFIYTFLSSPHATGWNWFFAGGVIGVSYLLIVMIAAWRRHVLRAGTVNRS